MSNTGVDYTGKKVVIGLTGRTASSVAALLLKKQGMQVIGVSVVTSSNDNFDSPDFYPRCHIDDLDSVKSFCDHLKIPFYATDAKSRFKAEVIDPFVSNKLLAHANTSCFNCTHMRIKILYEKMKLLKADYIATGHFCKVHKNLNSEEYFIHSNNDIKSDQSFLLAGLEMDYLKHLILPLGELGKDEAEKIAHKFNLGVSNSSDRKHFCFRDKGAYMNFAKSSIPKTMLKEGIIQNVDTDLLHGDHEGIIEHYISERELEFKGTSPNDKDLEIVGYDFMSGILKIGSKRNLTHRGFQIVFLKMGQGIDKKKPMECFLKYKYSEDYFKAKLFFKNNDTALVECYEELYPLIEGESFVIYDRNTRNAKVIGYGSIGNIGDFNLIDRVVEFRSIDEDNDEPIVPNTFKF